MWMNYRQTRLGVYADGCEYWVKARLGEDGKLYIRPVEHEFQPLDNFKIDRIVDIVTGWELARG